MSDDSRTGPAQKWSLVDTKPIGEPVEPEPAMTRKSVWDDWERR
jgi:hypothetical protein